MKRVLAVVLIATLTTLILGIDTTSWAQGRDENKRDRNPPKKHGNIPL